jgi:hypothetical protein
LYAASAPDGPRWRRAGILFGHPLSSSMAPVILPPVWMIQHASPRGMIEIAR